jgi:pyruvate kinase
MLSGETAVGKYPVEALLTMSRIAERVENSIDYKSAFENKTLGKEVTVTNSISHATCVIAHDLGASAIVTATKSGYTARMVSKYRPASPIIATTTSERTYRELALIWGVLPYISPQMDNTDEMIQKSVQIATETEIVKSGDVIVITGGIPVGISGTTNLVKVHVVGNILVKGTGMGSRPVYGKICIVENIMDARMKFREGDILVARFTDNSLLPFIKKAGGIITEEGGVTSHAAIVGLSLEIPTIVGAQEATEILTDGLCVTIDPVRGFVYNGKAKVI